VERFDADLQSFGNGAAVEVPLDVPAIFGAKRVRVVCTVNGVAFRTTVATYGGRYYIGFNREVRERAGVAIGDRLSVALERDESPREVDVPAELEGVLSRDSRLRDAFEALSYTHRKEYAVWVAEAKRPETRRRRAARAADMLRDGVRHP
jgi:Bacteriocin-protection, YdeI or OmpD-Associated/Domain of unknown function (DUF1905)